MNTLLLTNDDGYFSAGIQHLKRVLSAYYDVYIVAPDRERSAVSMALTITRPIRLTQKAEKDFVIDGTPADCVNIALQKVLPSYPDFVISGMNEGENLGEDVFFSGTVAGAFAGHLYGLPALAVSLVRDPAGAPYPYEEGARITATVLEQLLPLKNNSVVYNLNIPNHPNGVLTLTTTGLKRYQPSTVERTDPRNQKYYWIGAGNPNLEGEKGSDLEAIAKKEISLSVLKYDLNTPTEMKKLNDVFIWKQPNQ